MLAFSSQTPWRAMVRLTSLGPPKETSVGDLGLFIPTEAEAELLYKRVTLGLSFPSLISHSAINVEEVVGHGNLWQYLNDCRDEVASIRLNDNLVGIAWGIEDPKMTHLWDYALFEPELNTSEINTGILEMATFDWFQDDNPRMLFLLSRSDDSMRIEAAKAAGYSVLTQVSELITLSRRSQNSSPVCNWPRH